MLILDSYIHIALLSLELYSAIGNEADLQDYCVDDGFDANCPPGEMMLMLEALYGRMEFGTCLKYAVGMNCQSDVLHYMDAWCSGKQMCHVDIRNFNKLTDECPSELMGYLQARHTCMQVVNIGERCCSLPGESIIIPINRGHIGSSVVPETICNDDNCPLIIQASSGQHVNISIFNFNTSATAPYDSTNIEARHQNTRCFLHAKINEEGIGITVALCVDDVRKRHLYTLSTNIVEVRVINEQGMDASQFVFNFEVVGCPDPSPPENGYVYKNGHHVFIRCKEHDDVMWEISCRQNVWHGDIGNCSIGSSNDAGIAMVKPDNILNYSKNVAIGAILSLAVLISIVIILIGFACIRRQQGNRGRSLQSHPPIDVQIDTCGKSHPLFAQSLDSHCHRASMDSATTPPQPTLHTIGSCENPSIDAETRVCDMSSFIPKSMKANAIEDPSTPQYC